MKLTNIVVTWDDGDDMGGSISGMWTKSRSVKGRNKYEWLRIKYQSLHSSMHI